MFKRENPVTESIAEISAQNEIRPQVARVSNRTSAKVAALLSALGAALAVSGAACGGNSETNENIIVVEAPDSGAADSGADSAAVPDVDPGCDPMPSCPVTALGDPATSEYWKNYYLTSNRFFRVDPSNGKLVKICEPIDRVFCKDGQTPQKDGCSLPVCPDAKACDPIPSVNKKAIVGRSPDLANYPTSSENILPWSDPFRFADDPINYPVIFDNLADCDEGFIPPDTSTYIPCDMIPTCKETWKYCDPLPRCQPGESPIKCEQAKGGYSTKEDCHDVLINLEYIFDDYHISINPALVIEDQFCPVEWDSSINENVYRPPVVTVKCLPVRECADGEIPKPVTLTVPMDCGKWGQWSSVQDYVPSCDPIKSCKK